MEFKTIVSLFFSVATLVAGIQCSVRDSADFLSKINKERLALCETTPGVHTLTLRVFNLTNPAEFLNGSNPQPHIAKFQETSPIIFTETQSRKNCSVNFDDLNINFKNVQELSLTTGSLDVLLNTANIAFNHFAMFVQEVEVLPTLSLFDFIRSGEGYLRENGTIRDLLLTGYNISKMDSFLRDRHPFNLTELQQEIHTPFSDLVHPEEFSLRSDPTTFGQIVTMNGRELNALGTCAPAPTATEGKFFSGTFGPNTILNFYSEDFCGVIPLKYNGTVTYEGVTAVKFLFADDALEKASCDCDTSAKGRACLPKGAVDVKVCQKNLPYVVSLPHFLDADTKYTEVLEGMSPNADAHGSYFIINPASGKVLESSIKYQLNYNVQKFPYEGLLWDYEVEIQDTVFPLLWVEKKFKWS